MDQWDDGTGEQMRRSGFVLVCHAQSGEEGCGFGRSCRYYDIYKHNIQYKLGFNDCRLRF